MSERVNLGGREMDLQEAVDELNRTLVETRNRVGEAQLDALNETFRETLTQVTAQPNYSLVATIPMFDGERPEVVGHFFETLEGVGELSSWTDEARLQITRLKLTGTALAFVQGGDQTRVETYPDLKQALIDRFTEKTPKHCFFQQLSVIQQRKGETIEAFADRVRALNEKTVRVTDNLAVNAALREEGDRRALDAFLKGLTGTVGEQTRLKFPVTMQEAITVGIALEHLLQPPINVAPEKKIFRNEISCYNCHGKGHMTRDCRYRSNPIKDEPTCWRCGRPGHVQRRCRARIPPSYQGRRDPEKDPQSENYRGPRAVAGPRSPQ